MTTDPPTSAQPLWFIDNLVHVHVDGEQSRGAYSLSETWGAHGSMPPLHVHHRSDETFYVRDGELRLFLSDRQIVLTPGQAALAPRGVPLHLSRRITAGPLDRDQLAPRIRAIPARRRRARAPRRAPTRRPARRPSGTRQGGGRPRDRDPRPSRDASLTDRLFGRRSASQIGRRPRRPCASVGPSDRMTATSSNTQLRRASTAARSSASAAVLSSRQRSTRAKRSATPPG